MVQMDQNDRGSHSRSDFAIESSQKLVDRFCRLESLQGLPTELLIGFLSEFLQPTPGGTAEQIFQVDRGGSAMLLCGFDGDRPSGGHLQTESHDRLIDASNLFHR